MTIHKKKSVWILAVVLVVFATLCTRCVAEANWYELDKLVPSEGSVDDTFGTSVSISSDYAIVGAQLNDVSGTDSGSAYIFKRNGAIWVEQCAFNASDITAGDKFGCSVSISGDYAIVGAYLVDAVAGADSGSAYIFKRSDDVDDPNWYQQAKLIASDAAAGDEFGWSVSINAGHCLIGARRDTDNGTDSGSAYIFKRSSNINDPNWYQQAKLTASDGQAHDYFGRTVSITSGYAIIGAPGDDDMGNAAGAAYIFAPNDLDPSNWFEQVKLTAIDGFMIDKFGYSVSISGEHAIVASLADDDNGTDSGSAYVFQRDGATWIYRDKITAADGSLGDSFGVSVSICDDLAIVGAYHDDDDGSDSGSAYIFKRSDDVNDPNWYQQAKLNASDAAGGDKFGRSVAVNLGQVLVGAHLDDDNGADSGSAYIFRYSEGLIYVDANATGSNNGQTWLNAYNYLQDALRSAVAAEQIWVAKGTYKPDRGGGETAGDTAATFQLVNAVALYGGFPSGGDAWPQRNPDTCETILSGDIGTQGNNSDNSIQVVTSKLDDAATILDGFTITAGNARGYATYLMCGGGMVNQYSDPTVANCIFTNNKAQSDGAGMWNQGSSPMLTNCVFSENTTDRGGGMSNCSGSNPTLVDCVFNNNAADYEGGGMYNGSDCTDTSVINCTFKNNRAKDGGGMYNDGNSTVVNCVFSNNAADRSGGGIYNNAGCTNMSMINCTFKNNLAESGGGMLSYGTNPTLVNCTFKNNSAENGGAIFLFMNNPTLINCTLIENSADFYAGGIYNQAINYLTLTNCILWDNSDSDGSDTSAQVFQGTSVVTYSCIMDNDPDDASIPFGGTANNNIDDDPLFVNAGGDDLRLLPDSPCIDAGDNAAVPTDTADIDGDGITVEQVPWDLDSRSRFVDGDCDGGRTVDMGVYEFDWVYLGDLDGDCDVDFADFAITANYWLAGK